MANNIGSTNQSPGRSDASEISLENIDEILRQEDPTFADSLNDIKSAVGEGADVELESLAVDVLGAGEDEVEVDTRIDKLIKKYPQLKFVFRLRELIQKFLHQRIVIWRGKLKLLFVSMVESIKTWPDRLRKLNSDLAFNIRDRKRKISKSLDSRSRGEHALLLVFLFGLGGFSGLILLNLKQSRWIPELNRPLVTSLETVAEQSWTYDMQTETMPFLAAFPQEKHNYLFPKVVVNLKVRGDSDAFTMGAFEFYLELDSTDAAIEVKSREVELHDLVQRVTEGFSYDALQTEKGKERLKVEIKKALNQKVVKGWVKDVYIKFFITKP
jgi:flagellar basal body-associated protein FliL